MRLNKYKDIEIIDSTLREGEQSAKVYLTPIEKFIILKHLLQLPLDTIELGNYDVNVTNDFFIEETVNNKYQFNTGINFAVTLRFNINALERLLTRCKPDYIYLIYPNSKDLQFSVSVEENILNELNQTLEKFDYSKESIYLALMDFSKDFNLDPLDAFIDNHYKNFFLADTFGLLTPNDIENLFKNEDFEKKLQNINSAVHLHNDLGLAMSNTIAFFNHGIKKVSSSINGTGERAGIVNTEQLVLLKERNRKYISILKKASKICSEFTKIKVSDIQPIVGGKINIHATGIHIDLSLKGFKIDEINEDNHFYLSPFMGQSAWNDFASKNNIVKTENNYLLKLLKNSTKGLDDQNPIFAWGNTILDYLNAKNL